MDIKNFVTTIRRDYSQKLLDEDSALENPFEQFEVWLSEAIAANVFEPNAMVLATATGEGKPTSRIVLLRGFDAEGFTFFTNYDSRKGKEIEENPQASLLFFWAEIERQVRIDGTASKASREVSDSYFATRPRESQIGAWISPQSELIENRGVLEKKYAEAVRQWEAKVIQRPPNWGGFVVKPEIFEFWQGRESRLHDRLVYTKAETGWEIRRLAP
jgi:pyridoxamine 5'-phosphate oxidase